MRHQGRTWPFLRPNREPSDSIPEIAWVHLGGVEQWVMVRGENVANAPLIPMSSMTVERFLSDLDESVESCPDV